MVEELGHGSHRGKGKATELVSRLREAYPDAQCSLYHTNPVQLLVSTILSAQCTDERVNQVTPVLFRRYPDAFSLGQADIAELEGLVRSTGFFRNKARNIRAACKLIADKHKGKVPANMDDLLTLPGVARKTANVVLGTAFGISSGVVVDTHVARVSQRLELTKNSQPEKIEGALMALIPQEEWIFFGHALILHGRRVCTARNPRCPACALNDLCPYPRKQMRS
ncbi:MAG: endonuclease III [Armatimonadetes bacterium]|nr:endonuclease III [Armatimonadota bacterium]